ncbi:hypothetical protein N658DRAFT_476934 [Parathielavia hyrcaniae]|uniref:Uncharacterized protein n=1 Tax=Parathielavia hyrcaniae TaxID=113614 RepID=A0AAN6Q070_9PEZI|nr:hypothetical protein N658DRAFT_476934 [Parathielavia hyrcaniae]
MSAVKNLRAMFEQKGETSPPDRGRSPGPGDSPRPLSKIRTSFIAIEKDGRMGIQREGSQDSISALRKQSGDSNGTTPITGTEKQNPFDALTKSPAKMVLRTQPIAEPPRPDAESKDAAPSTPVEPKVTKAEPVEPKVSKAEPAELKVSKAEPVEPKVSKAEPVPGPVAAPKEPAPNGATEQPVSSTPQAEKNNGTGSEPDSAHTKANETSKPATRPTKPAPKPLPALSPSMPTTKPEKSPTAQKGPRTPATTSAHHPVVKTPPEKKVQPPEKPVTPRMAATSKPAGLSSATKPPASESSPSSTATVKHVGPPSVKRPPSIQSSPLTGFVKPRVKSPTRPIKLPPGLATHTAASGSKINAPRQSLSRASGGTLPADSHGRPASRSSASTAGSAAHKSGLAKGLSRQSSTANRARPSLGLPPKQPAKDSPPAKEIDQGFLARMMRPTAASASKTTAKVLTPPRKPACTPKKPTSAVKPVKKVTGSPFSARPKISSADQTAAGAEHAKAAGEMNLKTSAQEVAPAAEQSETAEKVVAAAQKAEGDGQPLEDSEALAV